MKAIVDKTACIGCGLCVDICPEIFELNYHGLSQTSTSEVFSYYLTDAINAASSCPVNAIKVI